MSVSASETEDRKPVDKWIPWFFVLFFAVFMIVDAIFVTVAVKTHTGVTTEHSYEKGLAYNRTLEGARAQALLQWTGTIDYRDGVLYFDLRDVNNKGLSGAQVRAQITRPVSDGFDAGVTLEDAGGGMYRAAYTPPKAGQWQIRMYAIWQDRTFQTSKTITVTAPR